MAAALVVVSVALAPAVAGAELVDPLYSRPEALPDYWQQAIARADAGAGTGRMLEIPGTRFAAYRWGTTYEPITAGNATVPTAWREQIPYGGAGSADVLIALDNQLQEGLLDPAALARSRACWARRSCSCATTCSTSATTPSLPTACGAS